MHIGIHHRFVVWVLVCGSLTCAATAGEPWDVHLSTTAAPGEPMVIEGVVYDRDGTTPLAGAEIYVYHTDAAGSYGPDGNSDPRIKGTLVSDAQGRFRFHSVRPGPYPGGGVPAHVHVHVTLAGRAAYVTEFHFKGDPYLRPAAQARAGQPFADVIVLEKDTQGTWRGTWHCRYGG